MAPMDPHSYAEASQALTTHVHLDLHLDFDSKVIRGTARLTLDRPFSGELFLDTRDLKIKEASDESGNPVIFTLHPSDPIKGSLLALTIDATTHSFTIAFETSPHASALQWLEPSQTAGGKLPYVYTQCQAIHARSVFPCQDTPAARIRYSARLNLPAEMRAVMSAAHVKRLLHGDEEEEHVEEGRAVEVFEMEQPIPPYLFALAAGDIVSKDLGSRSRIYAEPSVVEAAAYEFTQTEKMIEQAESLFGAYDWGRFDLLVLPPSFPYGGMENPRMVFLTPTIIVGDRSGAAVVAHELAHSWTGNLITNSSANDFWLNEGFTTYAERRIVEVLEGEERVALHYGLGWNGLEEEMTRFKDRPEFTKLKTNQENVDPDEVYSQVPYEKGCFFLKHLEVELTRPVFDDFLKSYIHKFRFHSIDTETFVKFLKDYFPGIDKSVDLHTWIYEPGMPPESLRPKSLILDTVLGLVDRLRLLQKSFESGAANLQGEEWRNYTKELQQEVSSWQAQEWQVFLESVPKKLSGDALKSLDSEFELSKSKNWELRVGFLVLAAASGVVEYFGGIEEALKSVGRMKYLRPLYSGLLQSGEEGKKLAISVFEKAKPKYHPIAESVVQGLITKFS